MVVIAKEGNKMKNNKKLAIVMSILMLGGSPSWAHNTKNKKKLTATVPKKEGGKAVSVNYSLHFSGPSFTSLDGKAGPGASIGMAHCLAASRELKPNWNLSLTTTTTNTLSSDSVWDTFAFQDPSLTLSRSSILNQKDNQVGLSANVIYHIPTSSGTYENIGSDQDSGNGALQLSVTPSRTFLKGKLSVFLQNQLTVPLAVSDLETGERLNNGVTEQHNLSYLIVAGSSYKLSDNLKPYLYYIAGARHYQNKQGTGNGTPWGGRVRLGSSYQPDVKDLSLGLYMDFPTTKEIFTKAQIVLSLSYTVF